MTFKPTATLTQQFMVEAVRRYPEEACGLIVKVGRKQQFVPVLNTDPDPKNAFYIAEEEFQRASDIGQVVAIWHSHPDKSNQPSEADKLECENLEVPWFINSITKIDDGWQFSETFLLEPSGYTLEYIGRPYHYGLMDCYTLVVDYYKGEFGVELAKLRENRATRFWEFNNPLMENSIEELGFEKLYSQAPEVGDLFLIQTGGKVANHVAIYIGDDTILHHCEGRLSGRHVYGGYWAKHTVAHLRHPKVGKNADKGDS